MQINHDSVISSAVQRRFSQRARSVAADIGIQASLTEWVHVGQGGHYNIVDISRRLSLLDVQQLSNCRFRL